jgi:cell division protein FtsB
MVNKRLLYIFLLFLTFQIIFSFYYSNEIVSQNQLLNENLNIFNKLEKENKILEQEISQHTSIDKIFKFAQENNYQFIKKNISL